MIDWLVHHAEIISLKGWSYRLKGKEEFTERAAEVTKHLTAGVEFRY